MSNGSNSAAKLFAAADQVRPGQTAEHRSSFANLVQKKKTQIAPAALVQHQKAPLGSTTTSAQDFAEKYAIASENVVAAILNDANIKVEAGVEVDKSEQFMDWLRCIETDDERCIQFLVKASLSFQPYPSVVHMLDTQNSAYRFSFKMPLRHVFACLCVPE